MSEERVWHIYTDKGAQGPYTASEIRAWKDGGQLTDDWYVWRDGFANWQRLGDTPEIFASSQTQTPASPVPQEQATSQLQTAAQPVKLCPACRQYSQDETRCTQCGVIFREWEQKQNTKSKDSGAQKEAVALQKVSFNVQEHIAEIIAGVVLTIVLAAAFLSKTSDVIIYGFIGGGLFLAVLGVFIKPKGADIGWSPLFGVAANSSAIGKAVFFSGVLILLLGGKLLLRPMPTTYTGPQGYPMTFSNPQCEPRVALGPLKFMGTGCIRDSLSLPWRPEKLGGYCSATVLQWEPDGILDATVEGGSANCPSTPETRRMYVLGINPGDAPPGGPPMSPDAAAWAAQHFPPGTKFWADPDTTKTSYQTPGASYIVLGYPKDLYGKIFYEIFKENGKQ